MIDECSTNDFLIHIRLHLSVHVCVLGGGGGRGSADVQIEEKAQLSALSQ